MLPWSLLALAVFAAAVARYGVSVEVLRLWVWRKNGTLRHGRAVDSVPADRRQIRSEVLWSLAASVALAGLITWEVRAWQTGRTLIYLEAGRFGWMYLILSVPLMGFVHETYFYWMHRLLHREPFYSILHRVHHQFVRPGPWAAFSFHPVEIFFTHAILLVLPFVLPLHPAAIGVYLLLMAVSSVVNHLGVELYPAAKGISATVGRGFIGATHHSQHHRLYTYNFGLYTTFWDRVAGTQHPDFDRDFDRIHEQGMQDNAPLP
ncbi:MAG TPA: sterol desaturase family protein [Bdellovibrionota bacterium]|nr:sterol desaturase family protein [Bdellovibrionota bacterium]